MSILITEADYDTIRKAIDITVDENMLPGDVIALPIYEAAAIRKILERDPAAESRTGTALARVKSAAVLFCAALLAPAMTGKMVSSLSVQTRDLNYTRPPYDGVKRAAELLAMAEVELAEVVTPEDELYSVVTLDRTDAYS
jgi:hypothetical protein